jgi:valyl-tRNA synthetase
VEAAWYAWWEKSGFFKPEYGRKSVKDIPEVGKMYSVHLNRIFGSHKFFWF